MQSVTTERISNALTKASGFFSFVIGLGISVLLFHRDYAVMRTLAVPLQDVVEKVSKSDGKCYKYRVEDADCEIPSMG